MRRKATPCKAALAAVLLMLTVVLPHHHHFGGSECFVLEMCALDGDLNDEHTHHADASSPSDCSLQFYTPELSLHEGEAHGDFTLHFSLWGAPIPQCSQICIFSLESMPAAPEAIFQTCPAARHEARRGPPTI